MAHIINNKLIKRTNTVTLNTSGKFVDQNIEVVTTAKEANFGNIPNSDNREYTKDPQGLPVIPANGSLFIDAGWVDNIEISLGHLIPDDTNLQNAGNGNILEDFEAYDSDGNKLVGTIKTVIPVLSGGDVTAEASGNVTQTPKVKVTTIIDTDGNDYGITTTKPAVPDDIYINTIALSPEVTIGNVKAEANASRSQIIYASDAQGYINLNEAIALDGDSAIKNTTDIKVTPTVDLLSPIVYIHTGSVVSNPTTPIITNPTAKCTISLDTDSGTFEGALTTPPTSGHYIMISPMLTTTAGTAKSTATSTTTAGLVKATTSSVVTGAASAINVTNNTAESSKKYIPIYDGSYTIV